MNAAPGEQFHGKTYVRMPQRNQCNRKPGSDAERVTRPDSIIADLPDVVLKPSRSLQKNPGSSLCYHIIDGERLGSVELVERLHDLGGKHGVGRIDHVEDRLVGIKSREIYEAPAAVILHTAHHALEGLVLSKDQLRFNRLVADELAQIVYDGLWFSALSRDLRTYAMSSQRVVSGDVRIRLDQGGGVTGRRSP